MRPITECRASHFGNLCSTNMYVMETPRGPTERARWLKPQSFWFVFLEGCVRFELESRTHDYSDWGFHGFPQSIRAKSGIILWTRPGSLPSTSHPIHYSLSSTYLTLHGVSSVRMSLHRSPASRRRRRKWNLVPWGITGPPFHWGDKHRALILQVGGWTQDWQLCSVEKYCCEIQRSEKPDGLIF
jgi:hypothetical protein